METGPLVVSSVYCASLVEDVNVSAACILCLSAYNVTMLAFLPVTRKSIRTGNRARLILLLFGVSLLQMSASPSTQEMPSS